MASGMTLDGDLDEQMQRSVVGLIADLARHGLIAADMLDDVLRHKGQGDATLNDYLFFLLDAIVTAASRAGAAIVPIRDGARDVKQLRAARRRFTASVYSDPRLEALQDREVRNRVEHHDERFEEAVISAGFGAGIVDQVVGPRERMIHVEGSPPPIWKRQFDPVTGRYMVLDQEVDVRRLTEALKVAWDVSRQWQQAHWP